MASEKMMKTFGLLCSDDFVDLDKNIIQNIFTKHFQELLGDPEIKKKPFSLLGLSLLFTHLVVI